MRACCKAQRVIVLRPIQNREVLRPLRGSNPARMTLKTKRYVGRAETRRRYALARPCPVFVSRLEMGRDVGLAKSGFRPTGRFKPSEQRPLQV
jgi:hypothetical protein